VKLPKRTREEPQPPSAEQFAAILEAMGEKYRLLFVTIEQGALRLGEAVGLRWGDVDFAGLRLRLPRSATKTGKARFVYLPEWLLQTIDATCPLEDRTPERKVFQGSPRHPPTGRCSGPARARGRAISTRTTSAIGGSRSGTRRASRRGSSQSGPGTLDRR
jgi:integrase